MLCSLNQGEPWVSAAPVTWWKCLPVHACYFMLFCVSIIMRNFVNARIWNIITWFENITNCCHVASYLFLGRIYSVPQVLHFLTPFFVSVSNTVNSPQIEHLSPRPPRPLFAGVVATNPHFEHSLPVGVLKNVIALQDGHCFPAIQHDLHVHDIRYTLYAILLYDRWSTCCLP